MSKNQLIHIILAVSFATLGSGCTPRTPKVALPIVNDENCKPENIASINDKDTRDQFQDLCIRTSTFTPSPKRSW